jgi:hypothetical protein
MIISRTPPPLMILEEFTEQEYLDAAWARRKRYDQNWDWFQAHVPDIYQAHRGKVICVAGQELFVADDPLAAEALGRAAHPEDDGLFVKYIPLKKLVRIYANQR